MKVKIIRVVLFGLSLWPAGVSAQGVKPKPSAPKAMPFVLPVSAATQRVVYYDTVRVPGASAERLQHALFNDFMRNFVFADYTYTATGPVAAMQPREPAGPGETVILGTITMFKPGEQPVFVAGITPPEALDHQPPFSYVHFTLRARFEPGVAYLTVTDLHQRTTTMKQEMTRLRLVMVGAAPKTSPASAEMPPSTPVETLYAAWLPGYKSAPAPAAAAKPPTQAEAKRLAEQAQKVLRELRYAMTR